MTLDIWEQIRTDWVNGNRQEARDRLYQLSKARMLKVICVALTEYYTSIDGGTSNGALVDLLEILRSYGRA